MDRVEPFLPLFTPEEKALIIKKARAKAFSCLFDIFWFKFIVQH